MNRLLPMSLLSPLLILAAMGVASAESKPKETADLAFFADQTVALFSQPNYGFTSDEVILIRGYYDPEQPAVRKVIELGDKGALLFAALGDYSVQLAGLSGQRISEAERVRRLHDYLGKHRDSILGPTGFDPARYDQVLDSISRQESFLGAIREFQPIVNSVGRFGQILVTQYEQGIQEVRDYLDEAIEKDFAVVARYTDVLEQRHRDAMVAIARLAESDSPSSAEEQVLQARLDRMQTIIELLEPRWELYRDTLEELDALHAKTLRSTAQARVSLLLWVRAHQRMATGLERVSWFDFDKMISDLIE